MISATADNVDDSDPLSSVLKARRGFDSIQLLKRMRDG